MTPHNQKTIKVAVVSHSDNMGGAAVVTTRLHNALRRAGVDSRMVVFTRNSCTEYAYGISTRFWRGVYFTLERARIFFANGMNRDDLFKVSVANIGPSLSSHPVVRDADVILLSWVNQGMLSLRELHKLAKTGKPIVWVMHDMWNMTGICHHAHECMRYKDGGECGCCPFLHSDNEKDLSHKVWLKKRKIYKEGNFHFIAVSNWALENAQGSTLLRDMPVETIHNAFPIDSFMTRWPEGFKSSYITHDKKVILMGAARLDDPIKGLPYAIEALNKIFDNEPQVANNAEAIFFGDLRDPDALSDLRFPFRHYGRIADPNLLRRLYARGSVVISSSLYETLPGTLIEGQAAGCVPVSFGKGGQKDIIDHKKNGYIARYLDTDDFARGIIWALNADISREELHEQVRERFASMSVAACFIDLFNRLLHRNG